MAKEGQVYLPPAFEDPYAGQTTDPETTPVDEAAGVSIEQARAHGFGEGDRFAALRDAQKTHRPVAEPPRRRLRPGHDQVWPERIELPRNAEFRRAKC